jgi:hypothetical protein
MTELLQMSLDLPRLCEAFEASWDERTSYQGAVREGNPAFGQCYPTARVMQSFFPVLDVARGLVRTTAGLETHFWNVLPSADGPRDIDLTWQQFPYGSSVCNFELLDRDKFRDSDETTARCALLLHRVVVHLIKARSPHPAIEAAAKARPSRSSSLRSASASRGG